MQLPIVIYSHSSYFNVLKLCLQQLEKYNLNNIILIADKKVDLGYPMLVYNNDLSYTYRWLQVLDSPVIPRRFLFMHEDFILYDSPDNGLLDNYYNLSKHNIRLLSSGIKESVCLSINHTLHYNPGPYFFSVQATIFNKSYLVNLFTSLGPKNLWECETLVNSNDGSLYFHYDHSERKRGINHYDSKVFPYMATAVTKGKWNTEYIKELIDIGVDYRSSI